MLNQICRLFKISYSIYANNMIYNRSINVSYQKIAKMHEKGILRKNSEILVIYWSTIDRNSCLCMTWFIKYSPKITVI